MVSVLEKPYTRSPKLVRLVLVLRVCAVAPSFAQHSASKKTPVTHHARGTFDDKIQPPSAPRMEGVSRHPVFD